MSTISFVSAADGSGAALFLAGTDIAHAERHILRCRRLLDRLVTL